MFARVRFMRRGLVIAIVSLLVLAWPAYRLYENQRSFVELRKARQEVGAREYTSARTRLTALLARWPNDSEILGLSGICDSAAGEIDSALAKWGRVSPDYPRFDSF